MNTSFEELKIGDILIDQYGQKWKVKEKAHSKRYYLKEMSSFCEKSMDKDDYYKYFTRIE